MMLTSNLMFPGGIVKRKAGNEQTEEGKSEKRAESEGFSLKNFEGDPNFFGFIK